MRQIVGGLAKILYHRLMYAYSLTLPVYVSTSPASRAGYAVPISQYILRDQQHTSPDEALRRSGPDLVAIQDLLQLAVGEIPGLADKVSEYGAPLLANLKTVDEVQSLLGVTAEQATKITAVLAVGKRLFSTNSSPLPVVQSIQDVQKHCASMALLPKEQLRVLLVNARYQLFHEETLAIGGTESLHISPREVFQAAAARQAVAIILVHNHPSGDPTPSEADVSFTKAMIDAGELLGIPLLDHVIITSDTAVSCLQNTQSS